LTKKKPKPWIRTLGKDPTELEMQLERDRETKAVSRSNESWNITESCEYLVNLDFKTYAA
jgi:hypothetical protein